MPGRVTVKIDGLAETNRNLLALGPRAGKAVLRRVLKKAAEPIYQAAKARAPVRSEDREIYFGPKGNRKLRLPGTTRALVLSSNKLTQRQARTARKEGKDSAEHYVGSRDRVARLIEFGTVEAPAQPFLRPAWDQNKDEALRIIIRELDEEIVKTAGRQARRAARAAASEGSGE